MYIDCGRGCVKPTLQGYSSPLAHNAVTDSKLIRQYFTSPLEPHEKLIDPIIANCCVDVHSFCSYDPVLYFPIY